MPAQDPVTQVTCDERRMALMTLLQQRINHEREVVTQHQEMLAAELSKQALEYEHRLASLNNNLKMILEERKTFYTRDAHDTYSVTMSLSIQSLANRMTVSETRTVTWTAAVGLGFTLLTFGLHLWGK